MSIVNAIFTFPFPVITLWVVRNVPTLDSKFSETIRRMKKDIPSKSRP